ncbi:MAG: hypothetical protein GWP91_06145 [Rhodobacterales bacterium]|nr:hypothetical protein [Rhodobacterales bacterium]
MSLWILMLTACSTEEPLPTGPDPAATAIAADSVCQLLKGAGEKCTVKQGTVSWKEQTIETTVVITFEEEKLGHSRFRGRVDLAKDGQTWSTPAWGFGAGRDESFKRGFHEWAVVSGVAIVDSWMDQEDRPALSALIPDASTPVGATQIGDFEVFRGFTLLRGEGQPVDPLDHTVIVGGLQPMAASLTAGEPHTLALHRVYDADGVHYTCHVDGEPNERLNEVAKAIDWPRAGSWEVKQTYILRPAAK